MLSSMPYVRPKQKNFHLPRKKLTCLTSSYQGRSRRWPMAKQSKGMLHLRSSGRINCQFLVGQTLSSHNKLKDFIACAIRNSLNNLCLHATSANRLDREAKTTQDISLLSLTSFGAASFFICSFELLRPSLAPT